MDLHFISAPLYATQTKKGCELAPQKIKEKYDFNLDMLEPIKSYKMLYNHINNIVSNDQTKQIITVGGDDSILLATIPAVNDNFNNLKIIYLTSFPDILENTNTNHENLPTGIISSICGLTRKYFINTKKVIDTSQIVFLGIDNEMDTSELDDNNFLYFTDNKLKSIGLKNIINILQTNFDNYSDYKVHIVLDVRCINNIFSSNDIIDVIKNFSEKMVSFDIVEYDTNVLKYNETKIKIQEILEKGLNMKPSKINIFNENSNFLIYKPLNEKDEVGWYVLTGLNINEREETMKELDNDSIITMDIEDETYLVAKTTIEEQNNKSYYGCNSIMDLVLYAEEKASMIFELVNL